jgi:transposase
MEENRGRRSFDRDFKLEVVRLVSEEGRSVADVSRSIGVHSNTIHNWKKQYTDDPAGAFPGKGHLQPEEEELHRLRRENASLKEDRAILKKALAIFSKRPV